MTEETDNRPPAQADRPVLVLEGPAMGRGDDRLGLMLLANFLRLLGERPDPGVAVVVFYNAAVKLLQDDSPVLGHLQTLERRGLDLIACTTCVEYFDLEGRLATGRMGTMAGIQELLLTHRTIRL